MVQPLVSHITYIAIGIVAILMITTSLNNFKSNIESVDASLKLNYIADILQSKMYEIKALSGKDFSAKIKIDAPRQNEILVNLTTNLITVSGYGKEVTRSVNMQMYGEEFLPGYLIVTGDKVTIE